MPTEVITIGPTFSMIQNVVYALPGCRTRLFTTGAPTLQQSNDVAFAANTAVTLTDGMAELAGQFIRCTSAGPQLVVLKKA